MAQVEDRMKMRCALQSLAKQPEDVGQHQRGRYDASGHLLPLHAQNYDPANDPWNNYGADEQPQ